jgi:hypothetical protein
MAAASSRAVTLALSLQRFFIEGTRRIYLTSTATMKLSLLEQKD